MHFFCPIGIMITWFIRESDREDYQLNKKKQNIEKLKERNGWNAVLEAVEERK
jgi:hypothetical protein